MKIHEIRERLLQPVTRPEISHQQDPVFRPRPNILLGPSPARDNSVTANHAAGHPHEEPVPVPKPSLVDREVKEVALAGTRSEARAEGIKAPAEPVALDSGLEEQLAEMAKALEPIEAWGRSATKALDSAKAFQEEMAQLAGAFAPVRFFRGQLEQVARSFEPLRALQVQVERIPEQLCLHLYHWARALEPAKAVRVRVEALAKVFEPVDELQRRFAEIAQAFRAAARGAGDERSPAEAAGIICESCQSAASVLWPVKQSGGGTSWLCDACRPENWFGDSISPVRDV
jgi:hypothetical protein